MPETITPDVKWAVEDLKARLPAIRRRLAYYEGKHTPVIPEPSTLSPLVASILEDLADNLCDDVVDEAVDRLQITTWSSEDSVRAKAAQDLWGTNAGDLRAPQVHRDAWCTGDGWVIVDADREGRPRWHRQDPRTMGCRYSTADPGRIDVAYRLWSDRSPLGQKRWRLNLYYAPEAPGGARLERWATRGQSHDGGIPEPRAFQPLPPSELPVDEQTGERDSGARDWSRVPVFHFPADTVGEYGRSVLTDVIPLQDVLNKSVADLVTLMEEAALPARFGTGIQPRIDPHTGQETPIYRRARSMAEMVTVPSKDAKFFQFDGQNPEPFLAVITHWRVEIARKGYLPPSSVGEAGTSPTGLSLLVQEGRMVKRGKAGTRYFGATWRDVQAYCLTLAGLPTEPGEVTPEWAPVETRDELARWELLALKRDLGVPERVLLVEGGYDPDDVEDWLEAREAAAQSGRVSAPGVLGAPPIASITVPGVPGGMAVQPPAQPAGAATPGTPQG